MPRSVLRPATTAPTRRSSFEAVAVETPAHLAEETAGVFAAFGALGCEIGKARGARHDRRTAVHAYFDRLDSSTRRKIADLLQHAGMMATSAALISNRIEDPGWATMWQKRFDPFPIGDRLLIVPPWNRAQVDGRTQIVIQPGQAFGTGHHASTFGTLRVLEELFGSRRFERVLDVGTGSGILAIAMSKLGASSITAIDVDPIALENANENADLNGLRDAIRFSATPLQSIRGRFDLIVANILSSVLIDMADLLTARLRPRAYLLLAGILARETEAIAEAYAPALRALQTRADGAWRAMLFQR